MPYALQEATAFLENNFLGNVKLFYTKKIKINQLINSIFSKYI